MLKLVSDVKTRWWSTHSLLERLLHLKDSLIYVVDQEFRFREHANTLTTLELIKLSDEDFQSLRNVFFVLTPFKDAQKALEGERYVNLSLLSLAISNLRLSLSTCEAYVDKDAEPNLYQLIQTMVSDFNSRWGDECTYSKVVVRASRNRQLGIPTYAFWATALDPRTKKKLTKVLNREDGDAVWRDIISAIISLHETLGEGDNNTGPEVEANQVQQQPQAIVDAVINNNNFFADSDDEESVVVEALPLIDVVVAEVNAYQAEKSPPMYSRNGPSGSYNNPLDWWRLHHSKYPNLWKLASIILAIPATSAPSERVFSAAANIVNKKRVRLKADNVDLLVFLRANKHFVTWD